ncbi:hypothetical protein ACFORL_10645 [Legionella dresdenensis]|uniref:Uncharacterized protein n=1 Tax=Legionella dresdenensis TaxID=450200 RepID=A0ABV8CH24_9GAMM
MPRNNFFFPRANKISLALQLGNWIALAIAIDQFIKKPDFTNAELLMRFLMPLVSILAQNERASFSKIGMYALSNMNLGVSIVNCSLHFSNIPNGQHLADSVLAVGNMLDDFWNGSEQPAANGLC